MIEQLVQRIVRSLRVSDDAFVERCRQNLALVERWRGWLIALTTTCVVAYFGMLFATGVMLSRISLTLMLERRAALAGYAFGIFLGCGVSFTATQLLTSWVSVLVGSRRERLLVRYHDALQASAVEAPAARDDGGVSPGNKSPSE